MYLVANQCTQAPVDELVPGERPLAIEFRCDDQGPIMRVVVTLDFDQSAVKTGLDQLGDFCWVHNVIIRRLVVANSG